MTVPVLQLVSSQVSSGGKEISQSSSNRIEVQKQTEDARPSRRSNLYMSEMFIARNKLDCHR